MYSDEGGLPWTGMLDARGWPPPNWARDVALGPLFGMRRHVGSRRAVPAHSTAVRARLLWLVTTLCTC
eukprot:1937723-Alexandrium_andersonii.AAC.1